MTQTIAAFVDTLLDFPPTSEAELLHRVEQVDQEALRAELVDRVERGELSSEDFGWMMSIFGALGVGDEQARLRALVTDAEVDAELRQFAFMALSADESVDVEQLAEYVGEDMSQMLAASLGTLLAYAEDEPDIFLQYADFLMASPPDERAEMFDFVDVQRRQIGLQAALAYRAVFDEADFELLWPTVGEAIVDDAVAADAELLEYAAAQATDADIERELRRQSLKLRTAGIEQVSSIQGFGLLGSCDGAGGFPVFVCRERTDGSLAVINLLFRATGELRDGFAARFEDRDEIDQIREAMRAEAGADLLELSLPAVVALCNDCFAQANQRGGIPAEFDDLAWRISRLPADPGALAAPAAPGAEVDLERTWELLDHPRHDSWFFDIAEFAQADVPAPEDDEPDEAWYAQALVGVCALPETVERVVAMAEHMARWHALGGEEERSADFASLAHQTSQACAESPLMRVMVERTLQVPDEPYPGYDMPDSVVDLAEDPAVRGEMRARFFGNVEKPTGQDVVALEMSTLSFALLEALQAAVPAGHQPTPEALYTLAHAVGDLLAAYLIDPFGNDEVDLRMAIVERLSEAGLMLDDIAKVLPTFMDELQIYLEFSAPKELYTAVHEPEASMPEMFFR